MLLKFDKTNRGFTFAEFEDLYGKGCSIQKSSLASEDAIWLGINDAEPKILASETPQGGNGWLPFHVPDNVSLNTRMHLSQEQVTALLPVLQNFATTGELSAEVSEIDLLLGAAADYVSENCETHGLAEFAIALGKVLSEPQSRNEILQSVIQIRDSGG